MPGSIPLEELASLPTFALVTPSYRRDKIAFYWDKTGRFELYVMDLNSRELNQLTDGQAPRSLRAGFVWSRDDRYIIFAKDNDGDERNNLYCIDVVTREVSQLNDDPTTQEYPAQVAPDNRQMVVMSNRAGQMNLFMLDLKTRDWRPLTDFKAPAVGGVWNPTGDAFAFVSNDSDDVHNNDGFVVGMGSGEVRRVFRVREGSKDGLRDWHKDGRRMAVSSDASGSTRAGILDLTTSEVRWLGQEGVETYAGEFSQDGRWLVTLRNHEASIMPVLYEVDTLTPRELTLPAGLAIGSSFVLNDTKLLVTLTSAARRAELVLYDLATDRYETLLAAEYGSIDPALFVADEAVRYPSFDAQQVPALLYKPRDIGAGDKLPALVIVHGGPTAQYLRSFDPYAQFLVDHGYVVLLPNVRGSTGYGVA